jgi:hypothetical protein
VDHSRCHSGRRVAGPGDREADVDWEGGFNEHSGWVAYFDGEDECSGEELGGCDSCGRRSGSLRGGVRAAVSGRRSVNHIMYSAVQVDNHLGISACLILIST